MKKIYSLVFTLTITLSAFGQTGVGVTSNTSSPYSFTATNVDSITTQSINLINTVAVPQTVNLSGLSAPFSTSQSTLTIPASDTVSCDIIFNPTSTGNFSDTLDWNGSIFGNGSLVISGEGVQVVLTTNLDTLNFGPVALGDSSTVSLTISNTGTGTMIIDRFIHDTLVIFTTQLTPFTISQGSSTTIDFIFTPTSSGFLNDSIIIQSNDPNTPNYSITTIGSGISEISGNFCNNFTLSNSPYTLVGDLNVADSCNVIIDPGVIINCNGYALNIDGNLTMNGTPFDSIFFNNPSNLNFRTLDSAQYVSISNGTNPNYFYEDFENGYSRMNFTGDISEIDYNTGNFFAWGKGATSRGIEFKANGADKNIYTGPYTVDNDYFTIYFDYKAYIELSCELEIFYRVNGGNWISLDEILETKQTNGGQGNGQIFRTQWRSYSKFVGNLNSGDQIDFRFEGDIHSPGNGNYNTVECYLDNFSFNKPYTNLDIVSKNNDVKIKNSSFEANIISTKKNQTLAYYDFEGESVPQTWDVYYGGNYNWTQARNNIGSDNSYNNNGYNSFSSFRFYLYTYSNYIASVELTTDKYYISNNGSITLKYDFKTINTYKDANYANYWVEYRTTTNSSWTELQNYYTDQMFESYSRNYNEPWRSNNLEVTGLSAGDWVEFRFRATKQGSQDYLTYLIDNIEIIDNSILATNNSNSSIEFKDCDIDSDLNSSVNLYFDNVNYKSKTFNITHSKNNFYLNNSSLNGNQGNYPIITKFQDSLIVFESEIKNQTNSSGIRMMSKHSYTSLYGSTIENNKYGIESANDSTTLNLKYSFIIDNTQTGIYSDKELNITSNSSMISRNGNYGVYTSGSFNSNYSNITFNEWNGINLLGNKFSNIKNSIVWGNDITNYRQINMTNSGITSLTFSTVQGSGAYGTYGSTYYYGDGSIDDDPVFSSVTDQHLSNFSNCVDAGTPWETDANMPYGLGGVRSDLGIYGGPDNWYWGGTPVPDGSPVITAIEDAPQDQGGTAGVLFDKSIWDNSSLINNVTHYSIWRHYDINGLSIDSIDNGNWERMGDMPAQGFNGYAYSSATLGDSNLISGMFNSCFVVIAHTADSSTYWYSNLMCGYSVDNLAPEVPFVSARIDSLSSDVLVHWRAPSEADYSYSNVYSLSGFNALGVIDTSALDISTLAGGTYTYGVVHFDVNGNPSDTAWVTITIDDNEDIIPLKAGWNLISSNKIPLNNTMQDIFGDLTPGNLVYVTGFNQGSSLYNPNGLQFLNTLTQFDQGYGYWVKVNQADTLRIIGNNIPSNFKINLNAGWNLSGYVNPASSTPQQYLGDLISANNLLYCTGFDQGTQLFNPNGLPFLNTLNTMQRPFGYWIKVNNPVGSSQYRLTNESGNYFSPEYMFINGKMNLDGFEGNTINVYNNNNEKLAEMLVIKEGYLMTTPIYGDDPQTAYIEGFTKGENLIFELNGMIFDSDITFEPNMELKKINLEFDENSVWNIYPNPTNSLSTISFDVRGETNVSVKVFDLTGKLLDIIVDGNYNIGNHSFEWNPVNYDKGVYIFKIYFDQVEITSERVVLN